MQLHQARPPYVEFRQIAIEDRQATIEKGRRVTKDINMAFIMQPGGRDQVEKVAEEWLSQIKHKMLSGAPDAYPPEWVDGFRKKFDMWKEGIEAPPDGMNLREVSFLSPSAVQNYQAMGVMTVEDLAGMDEVAMQNVGMGARSDRDKARAYLKSIQDHGAATEEVAALRAQVETQNQTIAELRDVIGDLKLQIDSTAPRRGRPPANAN